MTSMPNARGRSTFGNVAPSVPCSGNSTRSTMAAAIAPAHWLAIYGTTQVRSMRPANQKPSVTAGFRCAPEMFPTA